MPPCEGGYKEFRLGDLFDVEKTWIYGKNKQYITRFQLPTEKSVAVVSGITTNNGINYYTEDQLSDNEIFSDCLTISTRGEYSGTVTYHDGKFALANNILVMVTPNWSKNAKLYLASVISKLGYGGYSGYPRKETLAQNFVYLPTTSKGKIDFHFMESRIRELEEERMRELEEERMRELEGYLTAAGFANCNLTPAEEEALRKFNNGEVKLRAHNIIDTFHVANTHNILKSDVVFGSGTTPYVTASASNNSIVSYISYKQEFLEPGNSIMIGGKTLVITYQPNEFFSNDSHNLILQPRNANGQNESCELFAVAALYKSLTPKYSWGDSISKQKIQTDKVFLPTNTDNEIDYPFMETYISAIKKQIIQQLKDFIAKEHATYQQVIEETK